MARVRTTTLLERKRAGEKITALTAYDYPTAKLLDECGVDLVLVGDSCANNVMGLPDTLSITMDDMVHHVKMVSRAVERALVVADMPFLSYQVDPEDALRNAGRFVAEAGAHAVKLEGPADKFGDAIRAILNAGIPVMGHIGFTPQSIHQIGGYKVQGRGREAGQRLKQEALGLQDVGCFALVLELIQADVAVEITETVTIPTIGIGSGPGCDGQVLIVHDILGFTPPRSYFKVFGDAKAVMRSAFERYIREVKEGVFPGKEHSHQ